MATSPTGLKFNQKLDINKVLKSLQKLTDVEVLVGFPEDTTSRESSPDEPTGITNASLGYIHDTGAPEHNIPARPFMEAGITNAEERVASKLGQVFQAVLIHADGDAKVAQGMTQVGLIAKLAIQNKLNEGIDPALADSTLRARARKGRKGAQKELDNRKLGLPPSTAFAKPLIDTGQLRNAVNYVIRSRRKRSK